MGAVLADCIFYACGGFDEPARPLQVRWYSRTARQVSLIRDTARTVPSAVASSPDMVRSPTLVILALPAEPVLRRPQPTAWRLVSVFAWSVHIFCADRPIVAKHLGAAFCLARSPGVLALPPSGFRQRSWAHPRCHGAMRHIRTARLWARRPIPSAPGANAHVAELL